MSADLVKSGRLGKCLSRLHIYEIATAVYAFGQALRIYVRQIMSPTELLVLFRAAGIGDIVTTFPTVTALKMRYPNRRIVYCTRPEFREIVALCPEVDDSVGLYLAERVARATARFVDARSFEFLDHDKRHFALAMADSVQARLSDYRAHINALPFSAGEFHARVGVARDDRIVIAIHRGPTATVKEWPTNHWAMLVDQLKSRLNCLIIDIGTGYHFMHGHRSMAPILGALPTTQVRSFADSVRLLRSCDLFIGVDSGPLHLAAAVGTPTIGLFGPVNPLLRKPVDTVAIENLNRLPCQYCYHSVPPKHWHTGCPYSIACMRQITVDQVFASVQELVAKRITPRTSLGNDRDSTAVCSR